MNKTVLMLSLAGIAYYLYTKRDNGTFDYVDVPGAYVKEPGTDCPDTHFVVFSNNLEWCVPKP